MKISAGDRQDKAVDLQEIYYSLQDQYRNVFMFQGGEQTFLYTSLGRKDYRELVSNKEITTLDKEDVVCKVCVLWPENFDFDECDAGIPSDLCKAILKNSFLGDLKLRDDVLNYYRSEMNDLDNQISCIISEAFSQHDIEEIESWDMDRTLKYLSRAEWKLENLRGLNVNFDPFTGEDDPEPDGEDPEARPGVTTQEVTGEKAPSLRGGPKVKLTPEKLRELEELKRKFPEIDWDADVVLNYGKIVPDTLDPVHPALRPG